MMQKFWDSALATHPAEEFDARRLIFFCLHVFPLTKAPFFFLLLA